MRAWFLPSVIVSVACSDGGVRSGSAPEAADFLPMAADSADPASSPDQQPRLLLRCEQGRLSAYLVVDPAVEGDSVLIDERAVNVRLDSAPTC